MAYEIRHRARHTDTLTQGPIRGPEQAIRGSQILVLWAQLEGNTESEADPTKTNPTEPNARHKVLEGRSINLTARLPPAGDHADARARTQIVLTLSLSLTRTQETMLILIGCTLLAASGWVGFMFCRR